jgi:hypothetical protein
VTGKERKDEMMSGRIDEWVRGRNDNPSNYPPQNMILADDL